VRYFIHIPIIASVLVFHYFSSDIFNYFYLRAAEIELANKDSMAGTFYRAGEYKKDHEEIPCEIVPCDSLFVFVTNSENSETEMHYSRDGTKTVAFYINGKWVRSTHLHLSGQMYFIAPMIGFMLCLIAVIHDAIRTKTVFSWNIGKAPDSTEKVLYLYGCSFFGLGILLVLIKEHWLKLMA
jgi:hypothetical protein